jgi:CheY-like chemotaxis protein
VRCARDGAQAIDEAQSFAPEVVLLDVGLPQLDGYQVARRLRQMAQTRHALIVGLTGYGMPADRKRGREAGFDHHLLKPADPAELRKLIESWSPDRSSASEPGETKASNLYAFKRP